ncbi:hypothetical protein RRSWK_04193 [Rhodopirellula sp. SWK7]|nr:hypothetical protein RRSWK_04193 [Rhodopirellula sp. SWK7]
MKEDESGCHRSCRIETARPRLLGWEGGVMQTQAVEMPLLP